MLHFFFFHKDMLNRPCSTPDTQADRINRHYRSNEDCCVSQCSVSFPEQTRQRAGKYFACPLVLYLICARGISCAPFKNNLRSYAFFRKWPCHYKVTNRIITSFQSWQSREFFLDLTLKKQCRAPDSLSSSHPWMTQFSSFQQPFLARISGSCQRLSWERSEPGFICSPCVSNWKLQHQTTVFFCKCRSWDWLLYFTQGWCNTLETSTLWALTLAHTWQKPQVSGVLQLPVILHCGTICILIAAYMAHVPHWLFSESDSFLSHRCLHCSKHSVCVFLL